MSLEIWFDCSILGSLVLLERHKGCSCSYCVESGMKLGLNWSQCKKWNSWVVFHWTWGDSKWYLRWTRGWLFSH